MNLEGDAVQLQQELKPFEVQDPGAQGWARMVNGDLSLLSE